MANPTIDICYQMTVSRLRFRDISKARAAYDRIADAVKAYKPYSNDRNETVQIEMDDGNGLFKLEHIQNILLNDGSSFEAELRKQLETEKIAREMRLELGLPEMPTR